jgi:hypothetical protein
MNTRRVPSRRSLAFPVLAAVLTLPLLTGTAFAVTPASATPIGGVRLAGVASADDPPQSDCLSGPGDCNGESTPSDSSGWDNPTLKKGCSGWESAGAQTFHVKDQNWCGVIPSN